MYIIAFSIVLCDILVEPLIKSSIERSFILGFSLVALSLGMSIRPTTLLLANKACLWSWTVVSVYTVVLRSAVLLGVSTVRLSVALVILAVTLLGVSILLSVGIVSTVCKVLFVLVVFLGKLSLILLLVDAIVRYNTSP